MKKMIRNIVTGKTCIDIYSIPTLAAELGVTAEELVEECCYDMCLDEADGQDVYEYLTACWAMVKDSRWYGNATIAKIYDAAVEVLDGRTPDAYVYYEI